MAGDLTHYVSGNTLTHKDAIRAAGGRWDGANKRWVFAGKGAADRVARVAGLPGLVTGSLEEDLRGQTRSELRKYAENMRGKSRGDDRFARAAAEAEKMAEAVGRLNSATPWRGLVIEGLYTPRDLVPVLAGEIPAEGPPDDPLPYLVRKLKDAGGAA